LLEDCCGTVIVSSCCEKLIAEARNNSGTQTKANVCCWKPLPSNNKKDVTVDMYACVNVSNSDL
jgi:hypothetical protein